MRGAFLLTGFVVLAPVAALAEPTRDEVMSGAERCAGITDNRIWLDCFYGSAQPMRSVLGLPPAPFAQTKLVPPPGAAYARPASPVAMAPAQPRKKSGGFWSDVLGSSKPTVTDMPMASYRFAANGTFTTTLQNGQVYQQDESDTVFAKWTRPAASYQVTITPAADKFMLKVKGEPGVVFHVSRR
jgi:hypothetical protein